MMSGALLDYKFLSCINTTSPHLRVPRTPLAGAIRHGLSYIVMGLLLQWHEGSASASAPALKRWQLRFVGMIFKLF